ncbi:MAG: hypothetical protein CO158_02850 [Piscirickettsiaceae bacterium CG_4_9_14_3_um_filter_43_564]|nr:EAL domain-containing protein [Thiomicrospira sp.]OIP94629.1 MAG: hypothetical protein AUK56_08435 [Thiomicrospira sp. CG2_30_44_34]PIQ03542.1 MAG: hypothetical protein COW74_07045 [Piscirickettsiaceae bacterium CG18_big_fil_WC_8_21_14_2_50_44_103]PIU38062.1 MAG: hypothetical protein COT01_08460 [Piscirickettsiaceae bacterium CG07_land_8_20_14_0_80_44_28]PIW56634.1 MAG: hypothetical protein COW14_10275 [Piscirickettsiaceae bacterium CG12_big_fil_rev_8_21_14_0_65_44_934]PIW77246.1 MAG: hypot
MSQQTILVIDDDTSIRLTLSKILTKEGYQLIQAENGEVAIDICQTKQPDLILLDVIMPDMDGFETCQALRNLPLIESVPILMLTGLDDIHAIDSAFSAGATDFITKPINWPLLVRRVRYALRTYRLTQKLAKAQLRQAHAQDVAKLGFWEWVPQPDQMTWSKGLAQVFSIQPDQSPQSLADYLRRVPKEQIAGIQQSAQALLSGQSKRISLQHDLIFANQTYHIRVIAELDEHQHIFGVIQDISELLQTEKALEFQTYYDPITHLSNRLHFTQQVDKALAKPYASDSLAIISIDIDRFNLINNTLGHAQGDIFLKDFANRIRQYLDHHYPCARMSADEFSILVNTPMSPENLQHWVEGLQAELTIPYEFSQTLVHIETSVGIALPPKDGLCSADLLNAAVQARKSAKSLGGNQFRFYDPKQQPDHSRRLTLETALHQALQQGQFVLHYQPQLNLQTNKIVGVEALVRWQHPELGMISPAEFVPIIEEMDLIHAFGDWTLRSAVNQAKIWHDQGHPIRVGINLSARQFLRNDLISNIAQALKDAQLPPQLLDLEITEGIAMQNPNSALHTLEALKATGITIAIDDFGTGYSSLEYLQKFPVEYIKIDRAFIKDMMTNLSDQAIVRAIIAIANSMNRRIIAEGIEKAEEAALLKQMGCHEIQGYYLSKPISATETQHFIEKYHATPPLE